MEALANINLDGSLAVLFQNLPDPAWHRTATPPEVNRILKRLEKGLADGALGIGILAGYVPGADPSEYLKVAALAAKAAVPTYTHSRDLAEFTPNTRADGAGEIVRAAAETGAHMHYCHVNSTTLRHAERVLSLVARAQRAGSRVTTEAYPYGAGMTGIGAAFLAPDRLSERGLVPPDLTYALTGERVADAARLRELRAADPGAVVASDAMPLTWSQASPRAPTPTSWSSTRRRSPTRPPTPRAPAPPPASATSWSTATSSSATPSSPATRSPAAPSARPADATRKPARPAGRGSDTRTSGQR
ncbi:MAG TPA: hypothetical protein VF838_19395 [Trebonia sp.]